MSKNIFKIISFKTTDSNKSFCLSTDEGKEMYYADVENTLLITNTLYNKGCLRDTNGKIYSSLYNVKDLYLKSAIYGKNIETHIPNTNSFLNIFNYRLSTDLTNLIQVNNYIYQLNNPSNIGKQYFSMDIYGELSVNNGYSKMPNVNISTLLFDKYAIISAKYFNDDEVTFTSSQISNINNVLYNQLIEIPGNINNDYDSGNYAANVYTLKNQYDSTYNMNGFPLDSEILKNARTYIAVDHCNNLIYLKYYDNVTLTGNVNNKTEVNKNKLSSGLYNHTYQKIEVINALNRYESINYHKTNYFDVNVICEKLFKSFDKITNDILMLSNKLDYNKISEKIEKIKTNLQYEIANCIENICKQVSPVDTQLVKVYVKESEIDI